MTEKNYTQLIGFLPLLCLFVFFIFLTYSDRPRVVVKAENIPTSTTKTFWDKASIVAKILAGTAGLIYALAKVIEMYRE